MTCDIERTDIKKPKCDERHQLRRDAKSNVRPKADCKIGIADSQSRKYAYRIPDGLNSAIKRSEGILKTPVMKAFLTHVKGRKYPRKYAEIYAGDISKITKIIAQLESIVTNYYQGRKRSTSDDAQIFWMTQLIKKLKEN
ncbi:hypothetical protein NPIL_311331 [Nephila pilipes]|uniref:Uncharacterized protein n=1 Tax=Nephila pilipes TaxID=299642 RepID=A0A8X6T811_NEPPI|nr:hypothetical protein NPIL_311331 [Nephila pilipes]